MTKATEPARRPITSVLMMVVVAVVVVGGGALGGGGLLSAQETAPSAPSPAPASVVVPAEELVRRAAADEPIDLAGVTVDGDLDLRSVRSLTRPLRCRDCQFRGSVHAVDVVFERLVDLSGATLSGTVDLDGAVFRDRASFNQSTFGGEAEFGSARFSGRVSFTDTEFLGPVSFDRAEVKGRASFNRVTFAGATSFDGIELNTGANFGQSRLTATSNFDGAVFGGPANFLGAQFAEEANFQGAHLPAGGSFRLVRFAKSATFDLVSAEGVLDFDEATFEGDGSLVNLTSSGSVSLVDIRLLGDAALFLDQLSVRDFSMNVTTVKAVRGVNVQKDILELVERSAKARDDLAIANDARFRLLTLQNEDKEGALPRLLDVVFYRTIAGYLVRPLHPLVALLVLVIFAAVVRATPRLWAIVVPLQRQRLSDSVASGSTNRSLLDRARGGLLNTQKAAAAVFGGLATSATVAIRRKPEIEVTDPDRVAPYVVATMAWIEFLAYKVLIAVFILALGSSNATIRQLIDAVRS